MKDNKAVLISFNDFLSSFNVVSKTTKRMAIATFEYLSSKVKDDTDIDNSNKSKKQASDKKGLVSFFFSTMYANGITGKMRTKVKIKPPKLAVFNMAFVPLYLFEL